MGTKVLLSPTEAALAEKLKDEAIVSSLPEQKGADVLIYSKQGLIGLQRKEVPNDFLASFTDGRMARETSLLAESCKFSRVVAEGKFRFWPDGRVLTGKINPRTKKPEPSRFTRAHIYGMIFDIEFIKGIPVDWTDDIDSTVSYIRSLINFTSREKHLGLYTRPSAKGNWFVPTTKDIDLWLLQAFEGIGPTTADKIVQHFSGRIPVRWTCTLEELVGVPGLGRKKAGRLWESLPASEPVLKPETSYSRMRAALEGLVTEGKQGE